MKEYKDLTVCFSGHRKIIHKNIEASLEKIITALASEGFKYFGTGGAKGFDFVAARAVLKAQETFKDIKLIIVIPCKDYYDSWPEEEKQKYAEILQKADKVKVLSDYYYRGCMQVRNKHLVDSSSVCVYYKYTDTGGTAFTVDYATKKGLITIGVI